MLGVLVTAATLATVALIPRGGGDANPADPGDVAACADVVDSDAFDSDAFNFGDAVACNGAVRRTDDYRSVEPPE